MYRQIGMWDQKWVIGNWKMNGRLQNNNALMHRFRILPTAERVLIGLAAPTVYLLQLHNAMQIVLNNRILTCAQDVSRFPDNGAYTGEVSAEMLADTGTDIVLIGHSERSLYFGEKNEINAAKWKTSSTSDSSHYCASAKASKSAKPAKNTKSSPISFPSCKGWIPKHRRRLRTRLGNRHRQSRHRRTDCRYARIHLQRNLVFVRKRC